MCFCNDWERKERIALSTLFSLLIVPQVLSILVNVLFSFGYPAVASAVVNKKYEIGISKGYEKSTNICGTTTIKRLYLSLSHNGFLFLLGQVGR